MAIERMKINVGLRSWDDSFGAPLASFIEELTVLLDSAPPEHRRDVQIEFDRYGGGYETTHGELSVGYQRLETNKEMQERSYAAENQKRYREEHERATYEALKAKFG